MGIGAVYALDLLLMLLAQIHYGAIAVIFLVTGMTLVRNGLECDTSFQH